MKAKFYIIPNAASDPEPVNPAPIPFPIKIIADRPSSPPPSSEQDANSMPAGKRNDEFYPGNDRRTILLPRGSPELMVNTLDSMEEIPCLGAEESQIAILANSQIGQREG